MYIKISGLEHIYSKGTPFEYKALKGIDLKIKEGNVTAIIGETGSGKSTLVQHLNGLLIPSAGELEICGHKILSSLKNKDIKQLRKEVGLVFQFPEYQLFEETIERDIGFGPKNFGASDEEAKELVKKVLPLVGLDESYLERSPFELSGGQKRRIAIAGILVLDPKVLVLDEPAAGLDPKGASDMMDLFIRLNKEEGKTIILVSHDMEHVMKYCEDVVVLEDGKVKHASTVRTFFEHPEWMIQIGINPPAIIRLKMALQQKGWKIPQDCLDEKSLLEVIRKQVKAHE